MSPAVQDILLPKSPGTCGPLCGYDLKKLRETSLWVGNACANMHLAARRWEQHLCSLHLGTVCSLN